MKIGNIYIDNSFSHFIDLDKFPTSEPLFSLNLRHKVKSVKEIIYKERHSKLNTPLEIDKESFEKYSVFGHKITNCDFEYDSHGQKVKCYIHNTKNTSEYKHKYDQSDNCTETKCFENSVLLKVLNYRFYDNVIREETVTKIDGNKSTLQSKIEYDYLNEQVVGKNRFEIKDESISLISYSYYWYNVNKTLAKENHCGSKKWFYYDDIGRLIKISGDASIDFIYSKSGHLFQIQNHDRLIEFDEKGNCISNHGKNRESLHKGYVYDYDSFGNWVKKTERRITLVPDEDERDMSDVDIINMNAPRLTVTEREIEYYK